MYGYDRSFLEAHIRLSCTTSMVSRVLTKASIMFNFWCPANNKASLGTIPDNESSNDNHGVWLRTTASSPYMCAVLAVRAHVWVENLYPDPVFGALPCMY